MNIRVSLSDELAEFVRTQVASGRYSSSSEVVRDALRLLDRLDRTNAEKLRWLKAAWKEGVDSGDAGELDIDALKREAAGRLAARDH
jgi:antitoxin ParD1/3/4